TPEGLPKTNALFGTAHTRPIPSTAGRDEVQDFGYAIPSPLMRGSGLAPGPLTKKAGWDKIELEEKMSGRSKDLDALAIYCNSFEFPVLSPHIAAPGKLTPQAERGKQLFSSAEVGCARCHSGPYYTDSNLKQPYNLHDVGTGGGDPSEKMGPKYDTPTLLGVYRTAPYLHHGKAKTLLEVLTTCNKEDRHGKTTERQRSFGGRRSWVRSRSTAAWARSSATTPARPASAGLSIPSTAHAASCAASPCGARWSAWSTGARPWPASYARRRWDRP